jgi:23S rRNA U2552 (ribose-2'-O)-methylase RlmE/FtsJ
MNFYTLDLDIFDSWQDLCHAALRFSTDVLKTGGHFVCKFYQGAEDKDLEQQLKDLFKKVHRLKPESSRSVSLPRIMYTGSSKVIGRNPKKHFSLVWSASHESIRG